MKSPGKSRFKRVLLKLSGEAMRNRQSRLSIDPDMARTVAARIKKARTMGAQIAVVIGGGNIFRGGSAQAHGIDRNTGDYMGMLATVINALALQDALEKINVETRVQTAIEMKQIAEPFIRRRQSGTWKRAAWSFLAVARAIPILPPTVPRPCAPTKSAPISC